MSDDIMKRCLYCARCKKRYPLEELRVSIENQKGLEYLHVYIRIDCSGVGCGKRLEVLSGSKAMARSIAKRLGLEIEGAGAA